MNVLPAAVRNQLLPNLKPRVDAIFGADTPSINYDLIVVNGQIVLALRRGHRLFNRLFAQPDGVLDRDFSGVARIKAAVWRRLDELLAEAKEFLIDIPREAA